MRKAMTDAVRWVTALIDRIRRWVNATRPMRVYAHFTQSNGNLMAGGMSYTSLFSAFAALYIAFAAGGIYLRNNPELLQAVIGIIAVSAPGLIDTGEGGAIAIDDLLSTVIFGWYGAVAVLILASTALAWLTQARDAIRAMFHLPKPKTNFLLLKGIDIGLIIGFGAATVLSAVITVVSTRALDLFVAATGIESDTSTKDLVIRATGLLVVLALDTSILAALFRVLAGVVIPRRNLWAGSLLGGIALGVLKVLGSALLGGVDNNPLLTSFAVIIGLLLWFNLICRSILLSAAWVAVGLRDRGLTGTWEPVRVPGAPRVHLGRPGVRWSGGRAVGGRGAGGPGAGGPR